MCTYIYIYIYIYIHIYIYIYIYVHYINYTSFFGTWQKWPTKFTITRTNDLQFTIYFEYVGMSRDSAEMTLVSCKHRLFCSGSLLPCLKQIDLLKTS